MKNERYVKKLEKHGQSFADCVCSAEIMPRTLNMTNSLSIITIIQCTRYLLYYVLCTAYCVPNKCIASREESKLGGIANEKDLCAMLYNKMNNSLGMLRGLGWLKKPNLII